MIISTSFYELSRLCSKLESESKTIKKIDLISQFLLNIQPNETNISILLITGKIFPDRSEKTLNISYKTIHSLLKKSSNQQVLFKKTYNIIEIYEEFQKMARLSGKGSYNQKKSILTGILTQLPDIERKFLIRMILGEMRIGVSSGVMLLAIAKASNIDSDLIKNAYMIYGDLGRIGELAIHKGFNAIKKIDIKLFRPIKPMLAEMGVSIPEILEENNQNIIFEYKYDGIRVQIHKNFEKIKIYTRKLNDISEMIPDLLSRLKNEIDSTTSILDGELVAVDKTGKPFPFQDLMRTNIDRTKTDLQYKIFIFDILYLNGKNLLNLPLKERKEILSKISRGFDLAKTLKSSDPEEIKEFFQSSIESGHEGMIGKKADSLYYLGTRKKDWLKLKEDFSLDLVIIAAEWGSGRRKEWLSNYHLAAKEDNSYRMIGKTFKGLTDEEFEQMTEKLLSLMIKQEKNVVFVQPKVVVEVVFNEIQRSPKYPSQYALRFARIKNIRYDKSPKDIDTIDDIKRLYQNKFIKKADILKNR
ncbi:MAG: ATP-dependent DNA ligase [Candidatus Lokiarchaeota archaeon]|nr:ATP-dependent DNA ligase [Candidatus Lokiarchaeota archaeon]